MKYVVKKRNKTYKVLDIQENNKGYKFNSKNNSVKSITLINDRLINRVVSIKINTMFTRLLMIFNDAFNSDDNPSGIPIALDEMAMVKSALLNKYAKYLDDQKKELYFKKLALLEQELQDKFLVYQLNSYKSSGKSR